MGHAPEIIVAALETTLASMEGKIMEEPEPGSRKGAGAAKTWFFKAFGGNLDLVRKREHDARVDAKKIETLAEIDIKDREKAKEMGRGALGTRLEAGNQAAAKRIEVPATPGLPAQARHAQAKTAAPSPMRTASAAMIQASSSSPHMGKRLSSASTQTSSFPSLRRRARRLMTWTTLLARKTGRQETALRPDKRCSNRCADRSEGAR